ncbi:hypothetical protein C8D92_102246 [Tamilnaduibacter salinus]|uniref:Uncharacterized protein n=1 Tax=Tamilnaduibacter salinus TaxID=1484056 RepID=A0A2U1CZI5_9GAMM|nr:hypothetical protein C8D92_102246 [Tamilnaduibacter salinus]
MSKKSTMTDGQVDAIAAIVLIALTVSFAVFWVAGQ